MTEQQKIDHLAEIDTMQSETEARRAEIQRKLDAMYGEFITLAKSLQIVEGVVQKLLCAKTELDSRQPDE